MAMPEPIRELKQFTGQLWTDCRAFEEITLGLNILRGYLGRWYRWGGDDPDGFDCSGLAMEWLKMLGVMSGKADFTAQQIAEKMTTSRSLADYLPGDLVFFGTDRTHITHVEICVSKYLAMGASGGGSKTITAADAARDNAWIKIRPIIVGRGGNPIQLFGHTKKDLVKVFATGLPIA